MCQQHLQSTKKPTTRVEYIQEERETKTADTALCSQRSVNDFDQSYVLKKPNNTK
jgi:hypothetical protein